MATSSEFGPVTRRGPPYHATPAGGLDRRQILKAALITAPVLAGALSRPVAAQPRSAASTRLKLEEFVKEPKRVASLRRGVAAMKARPPSDPRSWFFQAAVHAVRPEWVEAARSRDPKVGQVDQARFWNQCPHFGQPSADFLLWHRAYLHYFERILRDAAQDDDLSLPYWNYTQAGQRTFPAIFADPDVDPVTQQPRNSLFDLRREYAFMAGLYELSAAAVSADLAFGSPEFFGLTETTGFGGGVDDDDRSTKGLIEVSPHDQLHFAIGGAVGFGTSQEPDSVDDVARGLMSSVPTAAFDPIFWVHHCNIDRMWSAWDCMPGRTWGAAPPEVWFKAAPWHFHDHDLSVANLERAAYVRHDGLGIRFDDADPACVPLSARLPHEVVTAAAPPSRPASDTRATAARLRVVSRTDTPITLSSERAVLVVIPAAAAGLGDSAPTAGVAGAGAGRRVLLQLEGVSYATPPSVGYDVYVNLPDGVTPDRGSARYVGALALFGLGSRNDAHPSPGGAHASHGGGPADGRMQQFDATRALASLPPPNGDLRVSIVPFDLLTPRASANTAPPIRRDAGVRVSAMRLVVVERGP